MLSEHDASVKWRNLFAQKTDTDQTIKDAQALLEELPLESPLRHRLSTELEEIRGQRKKKTRAKR